MIAEDGRQHVFMVCEYSENDTCTLGVHDTSDGAAQHLDECGYRYSTAGAPGWLGHGWYKHVVEGHFRDEWLKGVIIEMVVHP